MLISILSLFGWKSEKRQKYNVEYFRVIIIKLELGKGEGLFLVKEALLIKQLIPLDSGQLVRISPSNI